MQQENVLIWFEDEGKKDMKFFANIVDWQNIILGVEKGTLPNEKQQHKVVSKQLSPLKVDLVLISAHCRLRRSKSC